MKEIVENKNVLPYGSSRLSPSISIVDRIKEIEKADEIIKNVVNSKLDVILKQIKILQDEAKKIIEEANENIFLHKVKCNFEKRIGEKIHLYQKEDGEYYFSRLSPVDWNNSPPDKYIRTYVLNPDRSFTPVE